MRSCWSRHTAKEPQPVESPSKTAGGMRNEEWAEGNHCSLPGLLVVEGPRGICLAGLLSNEAATRREEGKESRVKWML